MNDSRSIPVATSAGTHVLQVVGNAIVGGMENYVAQLVQHLPPERYLVSVLAPFESTFTEQLRESGADVYITPITDEPSWQSIQLASALIRSGKVDVIQSHLPNAHVLAALAGQLTGTPVLATVHGRAMTTLDIEVQRLTGTHLAVVCRQSYFQALGVGIEPSHVHFVPNGVDLERFRPRPARAGTLRTRFAIAPEAPVVGFVGRLSAEKGPDLFLRAALSIRTQRPDAHFLVVGEGPMLKQLEVFAAHFGLASAVHFAGLQDDMPAVMNELDVVVSSSLSEAMPLAVMEAMASAVPVVAFKVGGVPDLIGHGVSGWLANSGDCEELALRVVDLIQNEEMCSSAGQAARSRAIARFSLDQSVETTVALYARLTASQRDSRAIGSLRAARPIRANGATVKSS